MIFQCDSVKIGDKFHRLEIIGVKTSRKNSSWYHLTRCICGTEKQIQHRYLINSSTKSCGCYGKEQNSKDKSTHKMSRTPEYSSWSGMRSRCLDGKNKSYHRYGGRGITFSDEWKLFSNFFFDLGLRPSEKHTLGRIDNNKNYCKENCRWETRFEQNNNRSNTVYVEYMGEIMPLGYAAKKSGISNAKLISRLYAGIKPPELFMKDDLRK